MSGVDYGRIAEGLDAVSVEAIPALALFLRAQYWPADTVLAVHVLRGIEQAGYRLVRADS